MEHCEIKKRAKSPRETANIFSKFTFVYTVGLFKKAHKYSDLVESDLSEVINCCESKKCGDKLEKQWILANKKKSGPSVTSVFWSVFGWRYLFLGFINVVWKTALSILEPYVVSTLISYFKPRTKLTRNDAYLYAALMVMLRVGNCFYIHNYVVILQQFAIEIQAACSSLLYRKALKLSPGALAETSLGNIVTLITKDVNTFYVAIWMITDSWVGIIRMGIISYLLYNKLGVVSFAGIAVLVSVIPLQFFIGKLISRLKLEASKYTDQRLQLRQETLSKMKIIKMYAWESYFANKIAAVRVLEVNKMLVAFCLKVVLTIAGLLSIKVGFYILVMAYIWMGYTTNPEIIFYIIQIFKDFKHILSLAIPHGMGRAAELYSSMVRINNVLRAEELPHSEESDEPPLKPLIEMRNVNVHIEKFDILEDVSFRIHSGLTAVTGTVGSGKSALLKTILRDYPLTDGHLQTKGRISYASQEPWLFPSSIKQNILFGQIFNQQRYEEVLRLCALHYDFNLLDKGDETIVSDGGLNLSNGQRARINLARAIYRESEIYLLDDSLAELDARVQNYIFNNCIRDYLKDKICVLVTQNPNHIQRADNVIVMDNGRVKSIGKPKETAIEGVGELILTDDDLVRKNILYEEDEEENEDEEDKLLKSKLISKKKVYEEANKIGKIDIAIYKKYLMYGGGFFLMAINLILFGFSQATESYSDKLITKWVDQQQKVLDLEANLTTDLDYNYKNSITLNSTIHPVIAKATEEANYTIWLCLIIVLLSSKLILLRTYGLLSFCRRASINLHKKMSRRIMYAKMSFYDSHFIGNILNRFSQDMYNIDEHLPFLFDECFRLGFSILGIVILATNVNWKFLILYSILFIALTVLRKFYLPTSRSLKRLETATHSPMEGYLSVSLEGLTTIRAYNAQDILVQEFDRHQNLFTSAIHTLTCSERAFSFATDLLCTIFIGIVISIFIFVDTGTSIGRVGLVLTQTFMLAKQVQWGIRVWANLENFMSSVERVLEYTEIKQESTEGATLKHWPSKGTITYENVTLNYSANKQVLNNLSFKVKPKQKIGIVGRTGAGKSSIISLLFRLYDSEGKILIDGIDIKALSLGLLRERMAVIPQDPALFNGTIRSNIDPFNEFADEDIWKVFEKLHLKDLIKSLEMEVTNGGVSYSSGQRQLICLARIFLHKMKIAILDEATANIDHNTDAFLHAVIKKYLSDCTVFIIAHRLHWILECDVVMVLDKGEIREFGDPIDLMKNESGLFYKMVEEAGLLHYLG